MELAYTILYVDNVAASMAFYEAAFGMQRHFLHESGDWGEMATGSTKLAFCSRKLLREMGKTPGAPATQTPCFEIALTTSDVAAAVQTATAAGAQLVQAPEEMPWGQTVAYVADADGFLVEICTPMSA